MASQILLDHVESEYGERTYWAGRVKYFREKADLLYPHDAIMATMLRRIALSIEQYHQRIADYVALKHLDKSDDDLISQDQTKQFVDELLKRMGDPSQ